MEKNNLKFFGVFFAVIVLVLSMYFVLADIDAPTGLMFDRNDTANYDNDGNFTVNWTAGVSDGAENYSIYIYADDVLYTVGLNDTDAATAFSFSNLTDANYTFTISAFNETIAGGVNSTNISMIVDTIIPALSYTTGTGADNGGSSKDWIFVNVTATDINNVSSNLVFSLYNSSGLVNQTQYSYPSSGEQSINWTGLVVNVAYEFNVTANDSATNSNTTSTRTFTLDTTNPSATATCSPSSVQTGDTFPCSCGGSDTGGVGINTSLTSSSSTSGSTSNTDNTGTFTYSCGVTDYAGNSGSTTATYTVEQTTGGGTGGGGATTTPPKTTHSWTTITPGVATVMKNFASEIGVREIKIEVSNQAQSVKITVTKYDGKPAEVSIDKTGSVYQYLQIEAQNLEDKLSKGTITIKVEKSWVSDQGLDMNDVALFKFDEVAGVWNELTTAFSEEDDTYYFYDVELTSFSYFAIGEKVVVGDGGELGDNGEVVGDGGEEKSTSGEQGRNLTWLWILIGVIVLAGVIGGGVAAKRKNLN